MASLDTWEPYRPPSGEAEQAAEEEVDLWRRLAETQDVKTRDALIQRYAGYASAMAAKLYAARSSEEFAFEEFEQFAMVGLIEAVDRFQLGRGAQFTTYATTRIRGAILSGLQHLSERQEQIAWRRRVMRERASALAPETFSQDGSPQLLDELLAVAAGLALGALLDGSGMMIGPEDSLPGNAYAEIELHELREQLWPLLDQLTEREREVIHMHYVESCDFAEIGARLQLSKGRVSQLHRQGLARLRTLIDKANQHDPVFL
jgi:RNA polymerase sigma factor for flagellar operon FliA